MNLFRSITIPPLRQPQNNFVPRVGFNGNLYSLLGLQQTYSGKTEELPQGFESTVEQAYASNGVVFACMVARQLLFSEARFAFRRWTDGQPGELYGTAALRPLERPWANGSTRDLLNWGLQSADLAGNTFIARRPGDRLARLRPDWVTLVLGSQTDAGVQMGDIDAEVIGMFYHPGGRGAGRKPEVLLAEDFAHFYPIPDPLAPWRGMSPLAVVVREIMGDSAATEHKLQFYRNAATPNMVVSLDPAITGQAWKDWVEQFDEKYGGVSNAYKTMYLGAGAQATVVGGNMQQLDFKVVQGAGETRIAAAFSVPPIIVGLSEGLSSATYSNYAQAKRRFADMTMRPLWGNMARSLESVINVPRGAELWYDDRQIPALQEDVTDRANVQSTNAAAIRQLVDAGFKPDTVVDAIVNNDLMRLVHTDLYSVQLQPPGTAAPAPKEESAPAAADQPAEPAPEPAAKRSTDLIPRRWYERHLPGQHDQASHAGGGGGLDYQKLDDEATAGGFSYTIHGNAPSGGCMVSPYKGAERVYDAASLSRSDVKAYRDNHRELLGRPDHYLGGWRDGDKVYLDVSVHAPDRTTASALARQHGQLAYYDLDTGETVPTEKAA